MKNSLIIITFFVLGILISINGFIPDLFKQNDLSSYALYLLIFLVGMLMGSDLNSWMLLQKEKFLILLVPIGTIIGTFLGNLLISVFSGELTLSDCLAVGAGYGYYSLSSIIISEKVGPTLGVIALISNIFREIFTLLFTPILVKIFGKLAPISSGGATSMDTTLPIITRFCGKQYAVISVFHGTVLTILVPVIVTLLINL